MEIKYISYIAATPAEVWQTLVSPEGTKATVYNCIIRSTFEEGSLMEYVGPGKDGEETVHVYGKVLEFKPNQVLSYTEHPGPSYYENHAELETRVTLTLETVGNCTKLTLVNDQYAENNPSYANAQENWPMMLSNIKTYSETGKALDFGW
jgi:uncharacterized protein YndB with AHSA1/START domain